MTKSGAGVPAELTTSLDRAVEVLRSGGLVAFGTETVYGLGANALDSNAVARIFAAKKRPLFDPLIVHLADPADVFSLVTEVPDEARRLMDRFWPGPLSLVLPRREIIPDLVTSGLPSVAVRVPAHDLARELIRRSGVPVAAPSANPFGRISPTTAQHVMDHLADEIDLVLDGGPCRVGLESTVLQMVPGQRPVLLRPGGITREAIEAEIGPIATLTGSGDSKGPQVAPGQLPQHYAPAKPLQIVSHWDESLLDETAGVLAFGPHPLLESLPHTTGRVEILSRNKDLTEAAANFFSALRRLDADPTVQIIYAESFPTEGLGLALNDRLTRAAAKS